MNLKECIAEFNKRFSEFRTKQTIEGKEVNFITVSGPNKEAGLCEAKEIITLQQEIIEMQQTGLEFYAKFRHCDYSELYEERIESDGQRAKEILEKTKEKMEK